MAANVTECPGALWQKYQDLLKQQRRSHGSWGPQSGWKIVLNRPGEVRFGKACEAGGVFFKHSACGAEYSCSNMPRTVKEHQCDKVTTILCRHKRSQPFEIL